MTPNIVFSFNSIKGDFILVNIDEDKREFESLSAEDITWYASDLINKGFKNIQLVQANMLKNEGDESNE